MTERCGNDTPWILRIHLPWKTLWVSHIPTTPTTICKYEDPNLQKLLDPLLFQILFLLRQQGSILVSPSLFEVASMAAIGP
jgi:hypothetical protein